jgi:hypothetical protein
MGDKGKKDHEKRRKQKVKREVTKADKKQHNQQNLT